MLFFLPIIFKLYFCFGHRTTKKYIYSILVELDRHIGSSTNQAKQSPIKVLKRLTEVKSHQAINLKCFCGSPSKKKTNLINYINRCIEGIASFTCVIHTTGQYLNSKSIKLVRSAYPLEWARKFSIIHCIVYSRRPNIWATLTLTHLWLFAKIIRTRRPLLFEVFMFN